MEILAVVQAGLAVESGLHPESDVEGTVGEEGEWHQTRIATMSLEPDCKSNLQESEDIGEKEEEEERGKDGRKKELK